MFALEFQIFIVTSLLKFSAGALCEDTGTIVPLYVYPEVINGVHNWQPLIDAHANHPIPVWAIVNVNSGPGRALDENYRESINMLKAAGINTLGYISTRYTDRDITEVQFETYLWKTYYQPNGIFFDEMAYENDQSLADYYSGADAYAKQQGYNFTVGNPGTDVPQIYLNTVDTIMIHETAEEFPTFEQYCGWYSNHPKKNWGIFPYNLTLIEYREKILAAKNCVGFIYITDDGGDNPWDALPPYLDDLFSLLKL